MLAAAGHHGILTVRSAAFVDDSWRIEAPSTVGRATTIEDVLRSDSGLDEGVGYARELS